MFPLDKEQINNLKEEDIEALCYLDSEGLLLGTNESFSEYKNRLLKTYDDIAHISSEISIEKTAYIDKKNKINAEDQLSEDRYIEPNRELVQKYSFKINWIPVFFHKNIGLLAGGCTLTFESGLSSILISKKFKDTKWLIYSLPEILTHELCHAVRAPIKDSKFEEFFSYNLSASPIRKYFGNCFRSHLDSLLLLLPVLLLFLVQLYKTFFLSELNTSFSWVLILVYPLFLLIRNLISQNIYRKATICLKKSAFLTQNISSILFRCNYDEIKRIAESTRNSEKIEKWLVKKSAWNSDGK